MRDGERHALPLFAIIIGINKYNSVNVMTLEGAVPDANAVQRYLEVDLNIPSSQIRNLRDAEATRSAIIQAFHDLRDDARIQTGDPILIYYAGHGGETDAPVSWENGGSKIQMLIPHDFRTTLNGNVVNGIPDRTIGTLLDRLAEEKGDNIIVIFDCCYSLSGTRTSINDPTRLARVTEVPTCISDDLDREICLDSVSGRGASGFLRGGMRSHVLLAACGAKELALEDQGRGVFTQALLFLLISVGAAKLRYVDVLNKIHDLPTQNPQCEGYHRDRFFFNGQAPSRKHTFYVVRGNGDKYVMEAGAAHGVGNGAEFIVYKEREFLPKAAPLGTLVACDTMAFSSVMDVPLNATHFTLAQPAYAMQSKAAVEEGFRLHIATDEALASLFQVIAKEMQLPHSAHSGISLVEEEQAEMRIAIEDGGVIFDILNPLVTKFGLLRMPFRISPSAEQVYPVVCAVAHYHWHLRRATKKAALGDQVRIEFMRLREDEGCLDENFNFVIRPDGPNLNLGGVVDIVVDKDAMYGIKIINDTDLALYPSLLFFDNSDLSVTSYFQPPMAGKFKVDPPLPPKGCLTLGYGAGNSDPFNYYVRDGQNVDVGFLKLFLTTEPTDLSHILQDSPFNHIGRGFISSKVKTDPIWDTILVIVVQRRKPAS